MDLVYYHQLGRCSYQDSLKILEADILHANALAAAIPKSKGQTNFQMKLVYSDLAPLFFLLLKWLDSSCNCFFPLYFNLFHILIYEVYPDGRPNTTTEGRQATIKEFYAIILPSLRRLHDDLVEQEGKKGMNRIQLGKKNKVVSKQRSKIFDGELDREEECGICLEPCTKMVLPNCCHSMCINCYRDWNIRSESCPFCRGGLKRVKSEDLWVLTPDSDVVDAETVEKENLSQLYLYIQSLPRDSPEALFLVYYEYLI